jgi:hypothetical protein
MTDQPIILREFSGSAIVSTDSETRKRELIAAASEILEVTDEEQQSLAIHAERDLKNLRTSVENARKTIKAPVIELGKKIDQIAADFIEDAEREEKRLMGMVNFFQRKQLDLRREAERKAQQERDRIQKEIDDARHAQEQAERKRKEAEDLARIAQEASTKRERDKAALEVRNLEQEAARLEDEAFEKSLAAESIPTAIIPTAEPPKGLTVKEALDFRVCGASEFSQRKSLAAAVAVYPHLFNITPRRQDILDAINKQGITEIPGLEIFEKLTSQIR